MPVTMDTRLQNFWVENIEKEAALRYAWQLRYSKQFAKKNPPKPPSSPPVESTKPPGKSFKENIADQIGQIKSKMADRSSAKSPVGSISSRSTSSCSKSSSRRSFRRSGKKPVTDMRPATSNTKSLLYNGISDHGEGRYAYLKKRYLLAPEEKFEFPILSSCQYGWKILDFVKEPTKSKFARTCIVRDTFYKSSGIDFE